jgi:hypothetical protein
VDGALMFMRTAALHRHKAIELLSSRSVLGICVGIMGFV